MCFVVSFALLSVVEPVCFGLVVLVRLSLSYGVRHMHSLVISFLSLCLSCYSRYALIIYSVSLTIARYALFLKYRGSGTPSIRVVQSKALYSLARI